MEYKGKRNTECPACSGNITKGHPMVFRINGNIVSGHLWCNKCFGAVYTAYKNHAIRHRANTPAGVVPRALLREVKKGFTVPDGYSIFGFWLATYENSNIGFQIDFRKED